MTSEVQLKGWADLSNVSFQKDQKNIDLSLKLIKGPIEGKLFCLALADKNFRNLIDVKMLFTNFNLIDYNCVPYEILRKLTHTHHMLSCIS